MELRRLLIPSDSYHPEFRPQDPGDKWIRLTRHSPKNSPKVDALSAASSRILWLLPWSSFCFPQQGLVMENRHPVGPPSGFEPLRIAA